MSNATLAHIVENMHRVNETIDRETKTKKIDVRIAKDIKKVIEQCTKSEESTAERLIRDASQNRHPSSKFGLGDRVLKLVTFESASKLNFLNKAHAINADFSVGPSVNFKVDGMQSFYHSGRQLSKHKEQARQEITQNMQIQNHLVYVKNQKRVSAEGKPADNVSNMRVESDDSDQEVIEIRMNDNNQPRRQNRRNEPDFQNSIISSINALNVSQNLKDLFLSGVHK